MVPLQLGVAAPVKTLFLEFLQIKAILIGAAQRGETHGEKPEKTAKQIQISANYFLPALPLLNPACRFTKGEVIVAVLTRRRPEKQHQAQPFCVLLNARGDKTAIRK